MTRNPEEIREMARVWAKSFNDDWGIWLDEASKVTGMTRLELIFFRLKEDTHTNMQRIAPIIKHAVEEIQQAKDEEWRDDG